MRPHRGQGDQSGRHRRQVGRYPECVAAEQPQRLGRAAAERSGDGAHPADPAQQLRRQLVGGQTLHPDRQLDGLVEQVLLGLGHPTGERLDRPGAGLVAPAGPVHGSLAGGPLGQVALEPAPGLLGPVVQPQPVVGLGQGVHQGEATVPVQVLGLQQLMGLRQVGDRRTDGSGVDPDPGPHRPGGSGPAVGAALGRGLVQQVAGCQALVRPGAEHPQGDRPQVQTEHQRFGVRRVLEGGQGAFELLQRQVGAAEPGLDDQGSDPGCRGWAESVVIVRQPAHGPHSIAVSDRSLPLSHRVGPFGSARRGRSGAITAGSRAAAAGPVAPARARA